jgi:hypothetical protein
MLFVMYPVTAPEREFMSVCVSNLVLFYLEFKVEDNFSRFF